MYRNYIGSKDWQVKQLRLESRLPALSAGLRPARLALHLGRWLVDGCVAACAIYFVSISSGLRTESAGLVYWLLLLAGIGLYTACSWRALRLAQIAPERLVGQARATMRASYGRFASPDELVETLHGRHTSMEQAAVDWDSGYRDSPGAAVSNDDMALEEQALRSDRPRGQWRPPSAMQLLGLLAAWHGAYYWAAEFFFAGDSNRDFYTMEVPAQIGIYALGGTMFLTPIVLMTLSNGYTHGARLVALIELARDTSSEELAYRREQAALGTALLPSEATHA
jgi:hypothetical protein